MMQRLEYDILITTEMKKIPIIAVFFIIFILSQSKAVFGQLDDQNFRFTETLRLGSRGADVTKLQMFLKQFKEIYPEGFVTGYFGKITEAALKRWQEKENIDPVGILGPKTKKRVNDLLAQKTEDKPTATRDQIPASIQERSQTLINQISTAPPPAAPNLSGTVESSSAPLVSNWFNRQITNFTLKGSYAKSPAIVWSTYGYGVAWVGNGGSTSNGSNIYFALIDSEGRIVKGPITLTTHAPCSCQSVFAPNITFSGKFVVTWIDGLVVDNQVQSKTVKMAFLDTDARKVSDLTVIPASANIAIERPGVKWTSSSYEVVWKLTDGVAYYTRLNSDATAITVNPRLATTEEWEAVTKQGFSGIASAKEGKIFFKDGVEELVSTVSGANVEPSVTFGTRYAIVWQNTKEDVTQLFLGTEIISATFLNNLQNLARTLEALSNLVSGLVRAQ